MRAIVQHEYGAPSDVLRLAEVDQPSVGDGEVLVRVVASSANPWDWHFIRGEPVLLRGAGIGGMRKPRFLIPGGDVAGTIEQVGSRVSEFGAGEAVYGFGDGAFAEYVSVPHGSLARKPVNVTFEQAAAVPLCGVTALQGLRAGNLQAGQHVLIIGGSGGVGTFAIQIAKHLGAEVTGVCSTANLDVVLGLGADHVLDYRAQDITGGPARYDMVLQLGGTYFPAAIRKVLRPRGTLIQSFGEGGRWIQTRRSSHPSRRAQPVRRPDAKEFHREADDRSSRRAARTDRGWSSRSGHPLGLPARPGRTSGSSRRERKPRRQVHRHCSATTDSPDSKLTQQHQPARPTAQPGWGRTNSSDIHDGRVFGGARRGASPDGPAAWCRRPCRRPILKIGVLAASESTTDLMDTRPTTPSSAAASELVHRGK